MMKEKVASWRGIIRMLVMVIFLGYLVVLIMIPTNSFYLHWMPLMQSKTNSTYFGKQGASILVITLPVLLIATLSCLYLHLGKRKSMQENSNALASWKRPLIIKGPLGIVSWIEMTFLTMFMALLAWSFSSYINHMFANITQESAAHIGEHVWEAKLNSCALLLGLVGNVSLAFLFFPVTRGSSILQFIGLTSEASIKYHIWLGHITMTLFTAHGLCYVVFWLQTHQITEMLKWNKIGISNLAGEISLVSGMALWATSLAPIRRKIFELFFYTHHLYTLFIVFFVFHVGFPNFYIILPGFYLFLIDRYLRFLQSQQRISLVSVRLLPCQTVELNFSKSPGLSYTPTSIMFINVPGISRLQWHPFTITSSSTLEAEKLSIVIKSEGSWSHKLYQKLSSLSPTDKLDVSVEGPYGPTSTNFLGHDVVVMISGGSGITPFISIIRELLFRVSITGEKGPKVVLICAFKRALDLSMLDLILPVSGTTLDISLLQLQIEAYVTREENPASDNEKLLQTKWLKSNASDAPISAILGQHAWLWLGTIISSSFVIFLLLIGILTQYYIYPIDHNSDMIYSSSLRSALNMLFISVSLVIAATAAFLWNKRHNTKEMRQIQNLDALPTVTSPGSRFNNIDSKLEMESFPRQSFAQATKVYYGARPNLKGILLECEGSSVGVLVSGPRKMRQEVAKICSSGLADNLHFESISFSW